MACPSFQCDDPPVASEGKNQQLCIPNSGFAPNLRKTLQPPPTAPKSFIPTAEPAESTISSGFVVEGSASRQGPKLPRQASGIVTPRSLEGIISAGGRPAVARPAASLACTTAISRCHMQEPHLCSPAACPLACVVVPAGLACWKRADCLPTREGVL